MQQGSTSTHSVDGMVVDLDVIWHSFAGKNISWVVAVHGRQYGTEISH